VTHKHSTEEPATRGKSKKIPYSVATNFQDILNLNQQLQAEGHALLARNRELRQSIRTELQRQINAVVRADTAKR
jgi:hypothetical protein